MKTATKVAIILILLTTQCTLIRMEEQKSTALINLVQAQTDTLIYTVDGLVSLKEQRELLLTKFMPEIEAAVLLDKKLGSGWLTYKVLDWGGDWMDSVTVLVEGRNKRINGRVDTLFLAWYFDLNTQWWRMVK